jgi:regulator of nucleoside diphosphate kinase
MALFEGNTMATVTLLITEPDRTRLRRLIDAQRPYAHGNALELDALEYSLISARTVTPGAVPANVVTMNSTVRVSDPVTEQEETFTLVFPGTADPAKKRVSILNAKGMAVLGYRAGDVVQYSACDGMRQLRIEEVLSQPEREGRLEL